MINLLTDFNIDKKKLFEIFSKYKDLRNKKYPIQSIMVFVDEFLSINERHYLLTLAFQQIENEIDSIMNHAPSSIDCPGSN